MKKQITAKDIARIANVSQATVSYVVNGRKDKRISRETYDRVRAVIDEYHYVPNQAARTMRRQKCTAIGLVCASDYSRQSFLNTIEGIGKHLDEKHYTLTLFYERPGSPAVPDYVTSYQSGLIDGLIYISNKDHDEFTAPARENNIPFVVVCVDGVFSAGSPRPHAFDDVLIDCILFCREHDLRRIRYFSVENKGVFVNNKFPEFRKLLARFYPEADLKHIVVPVHERLVEYIYPGVQKFFETGEEFDIAISHNYDIGYSVQKEIFRGDVRLPQSPKNIILNTVDFYRMSYPSVSSIYIPYHSMGEYAAKLILAIIDGREDDFRHREFRCRLVHRESTMF